jgi:hypothetical protein
VKEGMLGEVARTALLLGQVVPDQAIADKWLGRAHQAATQIGDRQLQGRARLSQAALRAASTGDLQAPGETVAKYLAEAGKLLDQAGDPLADSVREWKPGQAVPDRPLELSNPQRESSG